MLIIKKIPTISICTYINYWSMARPSTGRARLRRPRRKTYSKQCTPHDKPHLLRDYESRLRHLCSQDRCQDWVRAGKGGGAPELVCSRGGFLHPDTCREGAPLAALIELNVHGLAGGNAASQRNATLGGLGVGEGGGEAAYWHLLPGSRLFASWSVARNTTAADLHRVRGIMVRCLREHDRSPPMP